MPTLSLPSADLHEKARELLERKLREDGKLSVDESGDGLSGVCKGTLKGKPTLFVYLRHRSTLSLPPDWRGYKVVKRFADYLPEHAMRHYPNQTVMDDED
jgi:hypothetical protein